MGMINAHDFPLLVVDDKAENLYAFESVLTKAGFTVITARSGMEALKYLMRNKVSLVLMDVQMPEMNGFETAQLIHQKEGLEELPILFISATRSSDEFIKYGYSVGAYEYLVKPIDNDILISKVRLFQSLYCQHLTLQESQRATEALNRALQNNQELQEALERADKASRAKDEFLASMSHELRTPLTTIIGNSELVAEQVEDPEIRATIHTIENAGRNQLALVNDILDMSKIESGKFTIEERAYDLSVLLHDIEQVLAIRAHDKGVVLSVDQQNLLQHKLIGDAQRIGQILINLAGNAIKFTEEGRVTITTSIESGQRLIFQVKDTGIGMTPAVVNRLFGRFEQADNSISRRYGGSGLGLYISMSLAKMMDGTIRVSSHEGVGSQFELALPYRQSEEWANAHNRTEIKESVLDEPLVGRVLIAEDTPELQLLERRILEKSGLTVAVANNGREAVDQAMAEEFDLILMDMQMPEMNGIEATRTLRELGSKIPIIALTANVMQKHRDQFYAAGCDGFLGKPINRQELIQEIRPHLVRALEKANLGKLEPESETSFSKRPLLRDFE
jgi:two-component system, sensor histidine kinase